MSDKTELLPVTQEDREEAAKIMRELHEIRPADFAENGFSDNCTLVQAFARHRLATRPTPASIGDVGEEARALLADAFDEIGPTGYARHIRSGAANWPWTGPALRAIQRALLSNTQPATDQSALIRDLVEALEEVDVQLWNVSGKETPADLGAGLKAIEEIVTPALAAAKQAMNVD